LEYDEKFTEFWGEQVTHNLLGLLLTSENSSLNNFRLVAGDADDNKFADVYLASSADILVTNDRKLLALSKNVFPHIRTMTLQDFAHYLEGSVT
jgi:uncharacterized protein